MAEVLFHLISCFLKPYKKEFVVSTQNFAKMVSLLRNIQAKFHLNPTCTVAATYVHWVEAIERLSIICFTFYVVVVLDDPGRVPRRTSVPGETAILSSISIGPGRVPQQCVVVCPLGTACTAV